MRGVLLAGGITLAMSGVAWATGYQDFNQGLFAFQHDDDDAAIQSLTRATGEADLPAHLRPVVLLARGLAYADKKQFDPAIADLTASLALRPGNAETLKFRAEAYAASHRTAQAIADYTELIRSEPDRIETYLRRAYLYVDSKQYGAAIGDCNSILQLWPDTPIAVKPSPKAVVYWMRGDLFLSLGQNDLAIADEDAAIAANKEFASAYTDRGRAYLLKGDLKAARSDLETALADSDKDTVAKGSLLGGVDMTLKVDGYYVAKELGFVDLDLGRFDSANKSFAEAHKRMPRSSEAVLGLAISAAKAGQPEDMAADAASVDLTIWPGPIVAFWLGKMTPDQLHSAAMQKAQVTESERQCQEDFYVGEWKLTRSDAAVARALLQKASSECATTSDEKQAAQADLGRMSVVEK